MMQWIFILLGLGIMSVGADWLVKGCVRLARQIGISEFLVSVVIIGIGTALPELFIAISAGAQGSADILAGTIVSSNIINVWGILGLGFFISPILISAARVHTRDIAFLWLSAVALLYCMADGRIGIGDGILLCVIFIAYVFECGKSQTQTKRIPLRWRRGGFGAAGVVELKKIIFPIFIGAAAVYLGGELFMHALNKIMSVFNISETRAGLLIAGPATCAPELLVTIFAAAGRHPGVALGNILGSNFMNATMVIAAGALTAPVLVAPEIIKFDMWIMLAATAMLCAQLMWTKHFTRITGVLYLTLLGIYFWVVV
ncbi:MAG: sodium:calcium antiporter [Rickettsiales bacterium]|jgi:cation:H+ antiporter|nr:sodium:calcium antiporter [Rickettsiales bacterium]